MSELDDIVAGFTFSRTVGPASITVDEARAAIASITFQRWPGDAWWSAVRDRIRAGRPAPRLLRG